MRAFFASILVCSGWCWIASAQTVASSGAVAGFALESPGSGLPETEVVLWNDHLGVRRTAVSTDDGAFDFVALLPGSGYRLKLVRHGFGSWESGAFEVAIGQTRFLQIQMKKDGEPSREVSVASVTTRVDTTQSGTGIWMDPISTKTLPSDARRLDALLLTAPTTTHDATGRLVMLGQTWGNSVMSDGIRITKGFSGELPRQAAQFTQDGTLELRVLTAAYPVQFGHAAGGVVDAASPFGSTGYHADGFLQVRDRDFNAQNRFAPGQSLLGQRNHAGGSVVIPNRNRLFLFANLESLTGHFNAVNQTSSPALSTLPCTASVAQCTAALRYIQSQNGVVTRFRESWTNLSVRADYRPADAHTLSIALNARASTIPEEARRQMVAPNGGLIGVKDSTEDTSYLKFGWTAALPGFSNELRLGLVDSNFDELASEPNATTGGLGITVAGITVGSVHPNRTKIDERRFELVENFTITRGTHTFRIGADRAKTRDNLDTLNSAGAYAYPSLTAFALDFQNATGRNYSAFTQQFGASQRSVPYREIGIYAQDTWRAFSRLELTYGVRWEKTSFPRVPATNPTYYQTGSIPSPNNAVSPRLSLAYLFNDSTVLRVGYGRLFAPYQGQAIDALLNGNGLTQTTIRVNPNQTSAPLFPNVSSFGVVGGAANILYASKLSDPHTNQATLALERSIGTNTSITASWISSHAVDLWTSTDANLAGPTRTAAYPVYDASGASVTSYTTSLWTAKNDSKQAHVYALADDGWSWYNAGVLELRQRFGASLNLRASYTWSHATGTNTGPVVDGVFSLLSNPGDITTDKGDLATDQRHRGVINWTWQPQFLHNDSWLARYVVNGWQLSGIATLSSGLRYTPTVIVTGNQFSSSTMLYFTTLNGAGGWSRVPFQSVNSLSSDARRNLDARITRSIPIRAGLRCLVGFEAYNVFNSQPSTGINTVAYITSTTSSSNGAYTSSLRPVAGLGQGNTSTYSQTGTSSRSAQLLLRFQF